jgi:hypothetical protein
MPTFRRTPGRVLLAGAAAVALLIAPAAAFGAETLHPAAHVVADPAQCTGGDSVDAFSLACVPDIAPGGGAPGEMQLTDTNPGIASPSHGGR